MQLIAIIVSILSGIAMGDPRIEWTVKGQYPNGSIQTVIHQKLPNGWHTYWKNPGDSGMGARISPNSAGVSFGPIEFPKPSVISTDLLVTYGYINQVTYTLPITQSPINKPIQATFQWLECQELCVQKDQQITITIPQHLPQLSPHPPNDLPIRVKKVWGGVQLSWPTPHHTVGFFPYINNEFNISKSKSTATKLSLPVLNSTVTKISGELFLDDQPPVVIDLPMPSSPRIWAAILGAFLGGILLNFMPCVLPILGIKALQLQHNTKAANLKNAVYYALGIGISIGTLYGIMLGVKWSGSALGWGFQLQSPLMIQGLIGLFLIIMAINTDLMAMPLPSWASRPSNNMVLSGILTTVIATPCTAPFLGSAISVALFQPPRVGLLIFLALSLGLALPMGLLILLPSARQRLPKSGAWNDAFKYTLNFGFVATISWLLWVLKSQLSIGAVLVFFLISMTLFLGLIARFKGPKKRTFILAATTLLLGIAIIFYRPQSTEWQTYHPTLTSSFEAAHRPYFIDVTAKWCISCQTNKITVLNTPRAKKLLNKKKVALIRADWTTNSPEVATLLASHGKSSIPTYIYYNGQTHVVFGDILTFKKLKEHLK
jgi:thiol:disulfide interchange protein